MKVSLYQIARTQKPHSVGGDLILPAAKAIIQGILCDEALREVDTVLLLSDKTAARDMWSRKFYSNFWKRWAPADI